MMERFRYDKKKILLELIPFAFVLLTIGIALYVYPILPQDIPLHWNARGEADNFGSKSNVFALPVVFLAVILLFFVIPLIPVLSYNMQQIYSYYYGFKIVFSLFFVALFTLTLLPNFGYAVNVANALLFIVGLLFITLGFFLPSIKKNFIMGIRTPWTIASDNVWKKTHRLAGWIFLLSGVIICALVFVLESEMLFFIFIGEIVVLLLGLSLYSYFLYKHESKS